LIAAFSPRWASEITSRVPVRPRSHWAFGPEVLRARGFP
jgi:hypothetical protein